MLVFDWWLHNEDRYLTELGGNPNLLWDIQAEQLAVIDHNQAFDPDFDTAHFLASHVFSACWNRVSTDLVEQAKYLEKMETVLADLNAAAGKTFGLPHEEVCLPLRLATFSPVRRDRRVRQCRYRSD
ncbi:MAG: hypothetical protein RBS35_04675, partial [Azonexus sp.]|nr:hypothetical protein [Azonexus sp.]